MGSLAIDVQTSHVWEVFQFMGSVSMYAMTSNMGSLPMYGKSSHMWAELWQCSVPWIPDAHRDSHEYSWIVLGLHPGAPLGYVFTVLLYPSLAKNWV